MGSTIKSSLPKVFHLTPMGMGLGGCTGWSLIEKPLLRIVIIKGLVVAQEALLHLLLCVLEPTRVLPLDPCLE